MCVVSVNLCERHEGQNAHERESVVEVSKGKERHERVQTDCISEVKMKWTRLNGEEKGEKPICCKSGTKQIKKADSNRKEAETVGRTGRERREERKK